MQRGVSAERTVVYNMNGQLFVILVPPFFDRTHRKYYNYRLIAYLISGILPSDQFRLLNVSPSQSLSLLEVLSHSRLRAHFRVDFIFVQKFRSSSSPW